MITMLVIGILDAIKNKKKRRKPNPLTKGTIKYMMIDLSQAYGGSDLEIYDSDIQSFDGK
jgi:hypothetical protein